MAVNIAELQDSDDIKTASEIECLITIYLRGIASWEDWKTRWQ
jgi:hypothetical protein